MHLLPLAPLLLGCSGTTDFDLAGVWRFEVAVTAASEDDCDERLLHNLVGALEDDEAGDTGESDGWIEESTQEQSHWTGLGRFAHDGNALTLFIGDAMLPQQEGGDGTTAVFAWERSERSSEERSHASGYRWLQEAEASSLTRIQLTLPNETVQKDAERSGIPVSLSGSWDEETTGTTSWEEADLWPEELGLGDIGAIPFSSYLTRLDELGYVEPASNGRAEADCSDDYCVLSVNRTCATSWSLTATETDVAPGDDDWQDWVWDAGM